ncbi:MAG: DUF4403 family protein [Bernardetiaceae bacterium]
MRNRWTILLYGYLSLWWVACSDIKPERPPEIIPEQSLEPKLSYVNLPLALPLRDLEAKINEAIKDEIYRDDSYEGDQLKLLITKAEPLALRMQGNQIDHHITLHVAAQYKAKLIGEKTSDMILRLHFRSSLALTPDWRLKTRTQSQRIEWIKKPTVKVAFLNIPLGGVVSKVLEKKQPELEQLIDQIIYKEANIKPLIEKLWADIQKPILINKKVEKIWIRLLPQSLSLGKITGTHDQLQLRLRVHLFLETLLGEPQHTSADARPLPNLSPPESEENSDFDIYLFSRVSYKDINRLIGEQLKGQRLSAEGYTIQIRKAEVWPAQDKLIFAVKVKGDTRGTVYLRGKPHYEPADTSLQIQDFDFDLDSEESLLQTADWLLHDTFKEEIQSRLRVSLTNRLQEIPQLIQQGIQKSPVGEKIDLQLDQFVVLPETIHLGPEGLEVRIRAQGQLRMAIKEL